MTPRTKPNADFLRPDPSGRRGFSLLELLLVVALIGILSAAALTRSDPDFTTQLQSAAQTVLNDLDYVRSLAVSNGEPYKLTFDPANNAYYYRHTGPTTSLDVLPGSAFHVSSDSGKQLTANLASLPLGGAVVTLAGATNPNGMSAQAATNVEFNALGGTTSLLETDLWLSIGAGRSTQYQKISINPVTGLAQLGGIQTSKPVGVP